MAPRAATIAEKLDASSIPEPNSGCLLWTSSVDTVGYGRFRHRRKNYSAHRAAWEVARGPIPSGLHVLHKCDVRSCLNPDHLFLGTHQDNMRDRNEKGRARGKVSRGSDNWCAKLNDDAAREIYTRAGLQREIARAFGVEQSVVSRIKRGLAWPHATAVLRGEQ
jgi:hypothetical protein